ncbi:hypothetical protein ScPMuIL_007080 [Solemya velum]
MAPKISKKQIVSITLKQNAAYICMFGMIVCMYALYVELSAESDKTYRALCDISETISCSKVFTSRYGRGFGLVDRVVASDSILNQPNSVFGMLFYLLQIVMIFDVSYAVTFTQLSMALMANVGTVYLAYILYTMGDFCVVCVTTYVINFALLVCAIFKLLAVAAHEEAMLETKKRR